jgi:ABC-2 type transport system permease protein
MLWTVIKLELYKIASKPRSYIGILAVVIITGIIHTAMLMDGKAYIGFITQSLEQSFDFSGEILNGNLVAFIILQTLIIHIPLLIALVTGDLISGEANQGTLRLLLTKPISRIQLLIGKYIAGSVYTLILLIVLALTSLGVGLLFFGEGDLIVLRAEELIFLKGDDVLWRFMYSFALAYLSLSVISSLSFMLSAFTDNSIGPIITTMAIVLIFTIIGTIDLPLFDYFRPFMFTTYMISWRSFFENPVPMDKILLSIYVMSAHIIGFLTITFVYFKKKDIMV